MTTVSATTNEPNEQEFEIIIDYRSLAKHQQILIESLQAKCVLLEKQITIAVKALEEIRVTHSEDWCNTYALEALDEINRLQSKSAEGE